MIRTPSYMGQIEGKQNINLLFILFILAQQISIYLFLNARMSMKKCWDMVRKIKGKGGSPSVKHI